MTTVAKAGNSGTSVRSDCEVTLELTDNGGIQLEIKSKVEALYGEDIKKTCIDVLHFFEIKNAKLLLEDSGALSFVIMARIEAAIKKLIDTKKNYLPTLIEANKYATTHDRYRFSRLYLPGNMPKMMLNAGIHKPDGIILDLEDAVAPDKKHEARFIVRNALRQINFFGAEKMVRINQGEHGLEDLDYIVPHFVNLILIPKIENPDYIRQIDEKVEKLKKAEGINHDIFYMPIVESALGIENAYQIAISSKNIVAMAIGLEDYTADIGTRRTNEGIESWYARTRLVNACKAARIQPIDSVFSDIADMEGLYNNVKNSKALGFEGMGCIHPRQIEVIKNGFAPEPEEIEKAKKIVTAFVNAQQQGLAVVTVGSKMIDPPVVKRAEKTIHLALNLGLIQQNWMNETSMIQ